MFRTQCVLSLLLLYAGLVHSFDWEIVISIDNQLKFYDINGSLTHTVSTTAGIVRGIIYDPVHNRILLIAGGYDLLSFDLASKTIETLFHTNSYLYSFAYDPVSELLFWSDTYGKTYSILLKPGFNRADLKQLNLSAYADCLEVDICGGFIYWVSEHLNVERAQFDGSQREFVDANKVSRYPIKIDQQEQKLYWFAKEDGFAYDWIIYTDLNITNSRKVYQVRPPYFEDNKHDFTISKDHIYWKICDSYFKGNCSIWKIPKNAPNAIDILVERNLFNVSDQYIGAIAIKYNIEDVTRGVKNCERLKSVLPNKSVTNVATDVSLLCVHGTKVSEESRCECAQGYIGERCDVSVCHKYYCIQGNCSISSTGEPKCRCNDGYSGARCEVNACQGYCLHDGVCSLNENREPVCQCTANYTGVRCEVNACQGYCQNGGVCSLNENREPVCQCTANYTGVRCEVNACQGYCQNGGVCSLNENREPVCQCTANYTEARCEVNACQGFCLNGGLCSLNENKEPVCQCTAGYEGGRCDISTSVIKCIQTFHTCLYNTGVTSVTAEGVKSTSVSTIF